MQNSSTNLAKGQEGREKGSPLDRGRSSHSLAENGARSVTSEVTFERYVAGPGIEGHPGLEQISFSHKPEHPAHRLSDKRFKERVPSRYFCLATANPIKAKTTATVREIFKELMKTRVECPTCDLLHETVKKFTHPGLD